MAERPCRFCIATVTGYAERVGWDSPSLPTAADCELTHRDDERVYALARALAKVCQDRRPSDEQISWFLEDANEVVDDFDPAPDRWRVRRLPTGNDPEIVVRLRINDVTYVGLEGGKDTRGSFVRLSTFRAWRREAS